MDAIRCTEARDIVGMSLGETLTAAERYYISHQRASPCQARAPISIIPKEFEAQAGVTRSLRMEWIQLLNFGAPDTN